ncbi:ABHD15 [Pelobates cultripes]|uniref:Protein ABHD15 n=2 Tax=Pelobates cultripes TaxID=61616 RepID=A0AAD1QYP3_PELCU|nr:ABHD15 [Pelobates cultripes]
MFSMTEICWEVWSGTIILLVFILKTCGWINRHEDSNNGNEEGDGCGDVFESSLKSNPGGYQLICKPSTLANWLLRDIKHLSQMESSYYWMMTWPHLQTIIQHVLPADRTLELARDFLQMTDGGIVALDWVVGPRPAAKPRRGTNAISNPPLLLVIPNTFGRLTRNIQQLCLLALEKGYYPIIFNRRGQNNCPLTTLKFQPFGETADLKEAVSYVRYRHPSSMLFAVSEGLGSGLLLSYLGECGSSSYLTAACSISPVFRFQEWFDNGLPWLYEWIVLLYQKVILSRYSTAIAEVLPAEKIFASSSLRELHKTLFCQSKSETTSWDYYWECNDPLSDVDEVAIPILCICSKDDPIRGRPESTLPIELFRTNPYFFLLLTKYGGHCGFLNGAPVAWSHEVTLEYFRSVTEFFRTEEKTRGLTRNRGTNMLNRRRRPTLQKRETSYTGLEEIFSWKRSYTR